MARLNRKFFTQPALIVAKQLLGKFLVRKIGKPGSESSTIQILSRDSMRSSRTSTSWKKKLAGMIVETEAYPGPYDKASHAYGMKKTPRNQAEYLQGGHVYIYLVYGMYWQLNISTGKEGYPECVLIRALMPVINKNQELRIMNHGIKTIIHNSRFIIPNVANGPGKLCQWLKLDKSFYGEDLTKSKRFWVEDRGIKVSSAQIKTGPRIGIDYAGQYWAKKKWRFYLLVH